MTCNFTAQALDVMDERGLTQEDVQEAATTAIADKSYIYGDENNIFRNTKDGFTIYGIFTPAGEVADDSEITIESAYAHRIVFTAEEE